MTDKAIDDRLQQALEFSNYRQTLNRQLTVAKLKFHSSLSYSHNGGTFTVNSELISFIHTLLNMGKTGYILTDVNEAPVMIIDLATFLDDIMGIYHSAVNDFMLETSIIKKARSVKTLIES